MAACPAPTSGLLEGIMGEGVGQCMCSHGQLKLSGRLLETVWGDRLSALHPASDACRSVRLCKGPPRRDSFTEPVLLPLIGSRSASIIIVQTHPLPSRCIQSAAGHQPISLKTYSDLQATCKLKIDGPAPETDASKAAWMRISLAARSSRKVSTKFCTNDTQSEVAKEVPGQSPGNAIQREMWFHLL